MEQSYSGKTPPQPLDVATALRRVLGAGSVEFESSCPEVVRILDEYAEKILAGEDVSEVMPLVKQHLDICPDCCAECDALLRILGFGGPEELV
jgi:hypothetical protein